MERLTESQQSVAELGPDSLARFVRRTYADLVGAVVLLALAEVAVQASGLAKWMVYDLPGSGPVALLALGWFAHRVARSPRARRLQHVVLVEFALAGAVAIGPLFWILCHKGPVTPGNAAVLILGGLSVLILIAPATSTHPSFLFRFLVWGGGFALILGATQALQGLHPGSWFCAAMVTYACAAILHETPRTTRRVPQGSHAVAALDLLAAVMLLPLYLLLRLVFPRLRALPSLS